MPQLGDVIRLAVNQSLFGEEVANVYHYQCLNAATTIGDVVAAFNTQVRPALADLQSNDLSYVSYEATNLMNPQVEYTFQSTNGTGTVAGDAMPRFVAWGFKMVRQTKEVRNGSKRIAGVVESMVIDGEIDPANAILISLAENALAATLTTSGTPSWQPVIASVTGNMATGYAVVSAAVDSAEYLRVTTQNSRKR